MAGAPACRPLEGAAPAAVFAAVEAPALAPLPTAPFVLASWARAKVGPDIHANVGATLYSLPWRYLGERVDARATTTMVQFFSRGELIKTHPRKERGKADRLRGSESDWAAAVHTDGDPDPVAQVAELTGGAAPRLAGVTKIAAALRHHAREHTIHSPPTRSRDDFASTLAGTTGWPRDNRSYINYHSPRD